jgi:hypothetical protein
VDNLAAAANEAFTSGDGSVFAAAFTENGVFESLDPTGSFAAVGRPAITGIIFEPDPSFQVTIVESTVDGTTVTGTAEVVDSATLDAGVTRHIELFTAQTEGELVSHFRLTYDESDPETATYLEYLASLPEEDEEFPPGTVTIDMEGYQPCQMFVGEFEEEGIRFLTIEVEPGAEGVAQPAHIHTGTCAEPGPIVYPLASVVAGNSFTLLSAPLDELLGSDYIVNVHLSPEESTTYVSCAVLAEAEEPTAEPTTQLPDTGTGAGDDNALGYVIAALAAAGSIITLTAFGLRRRA